MNKRCTIQVTNRKRMFEGFAYPSSMAQAYDAGRAACAADRIRVLAREEVGGGPNTSTYKIFLVLEPAPKYGVG